MIIFKILLCFVPWKLRRLLLNKFFHYEIHQLLGLVYLIFTLENLKWKHIQQ